MSDSDRLLDPRRIVANPGDRAGARAPGEGREVAQDYVLQPTLNAEAEPEFDEKPECLDEFMQYKLSEPAFARIDRELVGFEAPFGVHARFGKPCRCADLEYRQFIAGRIVRDPDGAAEDRGDLLSRLPAGRLYQSFQEDGDTTTTPSKYGYRSGPASTNPKVVDQYVNAKGDVDQAAGCKYEATDTPFATMRSRAGEKWDIELRFYGEIRRGGKAIKRRHWTAIKGRFTAP
jgi:hypothetical protein